jgi:hypothetical protein
MKSVSSLTVGIMGVKCHFYNISVISWQSILNVAESEYLEKITDLTQATN